MVSEGCSIFPVFPCRELFVISPSTYLLTTDDIGFQPICSWVIKFKVLFCLNFVFWDQQSSLCIILTCAIFHHPVHVNVNSCPIPTKWCIAQPQGVYKQIFHFCMPLAQKMMPYQNVTLVNPEAVPVFLACILSDVIHSWLWRKPVFLFLILSSLILVPIRTLPSGNVISSQTIQINCHICHIIFSYFIFNRLICHLSDKNITTKNHVFGIQNPWLGS